MREWLHKEIGDLSREISQCMDNLFSTIIGFAMLALGLLCIFLIAWQFLV